MHIDHKKILDFALESAKGIVIAILFSLLAVFIFAFVLKVFSLPSEVIFPVNRVIKALAVTVGVVFAVKEELGLFKGIVTGILAVVATYFIFSAIGGGVKPDILILAEMLFGAVIGGISGVIAVNVKK